MDSMIPWRVACAPLLAMLLLAACSEDEPPANNDAAADAQEDTDDQGGDTGGDAGADVVEDTPDAPEPDLNACPDAQTSCLDQFGQPDSSLCAANTRCQMGCCVPQFSCAQDADCAARAGMDNNCRDAALECACDVGSGQCFTRICTADADCAQGTICASGACISPPLASGLRARLLSAPVALPTGGQGVAQAVAYDPARPEVSVQGVALAWSAQTPEILTVDAQGQLTCAGTGTTTLTVKVADNAQDPGDSAALRCLITPEEGLQIHLVADQSGRPVAGATVLLHGDVPQTTTTDEHGRAVLLVDGEGPFSVSAFAPGYHHSSVLQTRSRDLLLPMATRTNTNITLDEDTRALDFGALEGVDILQGSASFAQVRNSGEIEVALTGFGISQGLLDLNFELIIGPSIEQYLPPNTGLPIPSDDPIEIPGGVTLAFNGRPVVGNYLLTAPAGNRTLWSLGGRISISENPRLISDIIGSTGGSLDIGQIVAAILPLFENFYSGLRPGVIVGDSPMLPPRREDLALRVPTGLKLDLQAPTLPRVGSQPIDGVIFLGGALVPGQGFLPTGITAALDDEDEPDGQIDPVSLSMSPLHGGLAAPGARYVVATVGLSFSQVGGGGSGREATTILLSHGDPGASLSEGVDPARADFLGFDEAAAYDPATRALTMTALPGVELKRVVLEGQDGTQWTLWLPGGATQATLPDLTGLEVADPGANARGRVAQIDLRPGVQADFDALVSPSGPQLSGLIELIGAVSILEL
jgi:hypothetical protein